VQQEVQRGLLQPALDDLQVWAEAEAAAAAAVAGCSPAQQRQQRWQVARLPKPQDTGHPALKQVARPLHV
jgi:hypothetical protein